MVTKKSIISLLKKNEIRELFIKHHIEKIRLTGSFTHNEKWGNDIDILYKKNKIMWLFELGEVSYILEKKLWIEIDLIDIDYIKESYKQWILDNRIEIK